MRDRARRALAAILLIGIALAVAPVAQAKSQTVRVTGVKLNKVSASLAKGSKLTLKAKVLPAKATDKKLAWQSSNKRVAKVDQKGRVTAVGVGTAKITAKASNGKKASCYVTVRIPAKGVKLSASKLRLEVGQKSQLRYAVSPEGATNKGVTFQSSKRSVATVDSRGVVTARAAGTATITVRTKDGAKTAKCAVTVAKAKATPIQATPPPSKSASYADQVLALVNKERAAVGLNALKMNSELKSGAAIRAKEIASKFSHTRPNGKPGTSVTRLAYGENLASGYSGASAVVKAWMNSSGHRANILRKGYRSIGIAVYEKGGRLYWVQLFGA